MRGSIDQCPLVVLAMNLDQGVTKLFEHLHAHRLIVDESPSPPVGELDATEDQFIIGGNIVGHKKCARGVIARDIENGGHLALFYALPHQGLVAAATEGKGKSVEKDRLAGTSLASENSEAIGKVDVESVD
jgi:hypothetical protein